MEGQNLFGELAEVVFGVIRRVLAEEGSNLERASELVAESIALGGFEYVFGTGHSMLVALRPSIGLVSWLGFTRCSIYPS